MTAASGGDRPPEEERSPLRSLRERAGAAGNGPSAEPRTLDEILPERGDPARARDMQATWHAFCLERYDMVRAALASGRTPPEIAYQLGELVHTYFRPRGITLTSHELRRLVAELLEPASRVPPSAPAAPQAAPTAEPEPPPTVEEPVPPPEEPPAEPPAAAAPAPEAEGAPEPALPETPSEEEPTPSEPPRAPVAERREPPSRESGSEGLVTFPDTAAPQQTPWSGDEPPPPEPAIPPVPDRAFEPPTSPLVTVADREALGVERLLSRTLELVKPRLAMPAGGRIGRDEALRAIDAALDEVVRTERLPALAPEIRQHLVLVALSEVSGLGLVDRLWADHTVRAVFVNGPHAVFVEREDGNLTPAAETFRDHEHLLELVNRLAEKPASAVADVQLRDGATATVIFPPAAPEGPVLTLRRAEPGTATFARLIASEMLDQRTAALLRVAVRARLNILVLGPAGAGKTAMLAAMGRDLEAAMRLVTVARHRQFRWPVATKVELVASPETPYPVLLAAAERLRPEILMLDSLQRSETEALGLLASRNPRGVVAACEPGVAATDLTRSIDLLVRLARGRDGLYRAVSMEDAAGAAVFVHEDGRFVCRARHPAFAPKIQAAGFAEHLSTLLR
jgi:pilus assembly protein CpaF